MNPFEMLQMKGRIENFGRQHPRVAAFFAENHQELREGAIVEIRITSPEGRSIVTNMRLTAEDEATINGMKEMMK